MNAAGNLLEIKLESNVLASNNFIELCTMSFPISSWIVSRLKIRLAIPGSLSDLSCYFAKEMEREARQAEQSVFCVRWKTLLRSIGPHRSTGTSRVSIAATAFRKKIYSAPLASWKGFYVRQAFTSNFPGGSE